VLPDPPESLPPAPGRFYAELRAMLAAVRPRALDRDRVTVKFDRRGVDVVLPHVREPEWAIGAMVDKKSAIVMANTMHEHFDRDAEGRPWPVQAVDFIAELLRGEIEIETEYRGAAAIRVRHYLLDPDGQRHELGMTGSLRPALLMFWRATRTEVTRVTFDAEG
jgi:hypothetical protein